MSLDKWGGAVHEVFVPGGAQQRCARGLRVGGGLLADSGQAGQATGVARRSRFGRGMATGALPPRRAGRLQRRRDRPRLPSRPRGRPHQTASSTSPAKAARRTTPLVWMTRPIAPCTRNWPQCATALVSGCGASSGPGTPCLFVRTTTPRRHFEATVPVGTRPGGSFLDVESLLQDMDNLFKQ